MNQHTSEPILPLHIEPAQRIERLPVPFFADLAAKVEQARKTWAEKGLSIINLAQGHPDQPTPEPIVRALQSAAEDPVNHRYSPFQGFPYLKEAVAQRYKEDYGVTLQSDEIAILSGSRTGILGICQCLLNPGDACFMPDPGYPDYVSGIELSGARQIPMHLAASNGFLPDYRQIDPKRASEAKMMFLNYPNNPTGAQASPEFFEDTVRFAAKHHIAVVHDFAYGALGYDNKKPVSFMQVSGAKQVGIELYTLSKTYNMAGWRVGFAVGHSGLIQLIEQLQDHYYVALFGGIQAAAAEALTGSQKSVKETNELYETRRNRLFVRLSEIGWKATPPAGSFFSWLPVPDGFTSSTFTDHLLQHAGVLVAPGSGFGQYGEGYVRVGLNQPEGLLSQAIERIEPLGLFR